MRVIYIHSIEKDCFHSNFSISGSQFEPEYQASDSLAGGLGQWQASSLGNVSGSQKALGSNVTNTNGPLPFLFIMQGTLIWS